MYTCGAFQLWELCVCCSYQVQQDKNINPVVVVAAHSAVGVGLQIGQKIDFPKSKTTIRIVIFRFLLFPQIKDDMILFLIVFLPLSHISSYQRRQLESSFYRFLRFPQIKADNQNCLFTAFSHFLKPKTTIRIVFLPLSPTWRPGCGPRRWNPCRTTARRPPRHQRRWTAGWGRISENILTLKKHPNSKYRTLF